MQKTLLSSILLSAPTLGDLALTAATTSAGTMINKFVSLMCLH